MNRRSEPWRPDPPLDRDDDNWANEMAALVGALVLMIGGGVLVLISGVVLRAMLGLGG